MRFINAASYKLANALTKELNHSHEKKRVYYYGFQIVIGEAVKAILFVLSTLLLGIFESAVTVLAFFAVLRMPGGGYHMDNYTRCMVSSFLIFYILGFTVKYTNALWSIEALIVLSILAFAAAIFTAFKYAPADTPYKPITNPKKIKRFKAISIAVVILWGIFDSILLYRGLNYFILAGCLGMFFAAFIISPAGYRFFDFISGKKAEKAQLSA